MSSRVQKFTSSEVHGFSSSWVSTQFEWLFAVEVRTLIIGTVNQNWSAGVLEPLLHKPCTSACVHKESQWKVEQCNALYNKVLLSCFIRKWTKYSTSEVINLPCIMLLLLTYASIKDVLVQCYISPFPKVNPWLPLWSVVWLPFPLEVLDVKHNSVNWNTVVIGWFNYLVCRPLLILSQPPAWLHQLVFASTSTMRLGSLSSVASPWNELCVKLRLSTVKVSTVVNANPLAAPIDTHNTKRSRPSSPPATEACSQDVSFGSISSTEPWPPLTLTEIPTRNLPRLDPLITQQSFSSWGRAITGSITSLCKQIPRKVPWGKPYPRRPEDQHRTTSLHVLKV